MSSSREESPQKVLRGFKRSEDSSFIEYKYDENAEDYVNSRVTVRPLVSLTVNINSVYKTCNPAFKPTEKYPQRMLTNPSDAVGNNGLDNEEANLICRVNDQLLSQKSAYTILDLLGTGTFGQVFRCQKNDTTEVYAVKVIKNKQAYHIQGLLEIKVVRLLNNTFDQKDECHIVRLCEYFDFKGHICIVFELLSMSLLDILTQNQFRGLPLNVVQRFTKQLVSSLVILQHANVIHCDLKPENILLAPPKSVDTDASKRRRSNSNIEQVDVKIGGGVGAMETIAAKRKSTNFWSDIKVIDFGSACFEGRTMYSYIQSRFYRSPEILLGTPYNGSIDMWSLACVCAEMFLGLPLFPGVSQHNQLSRIVEMLGQPPDYMIEGKNGLKYFSKISHPNGSSAPWNATSGDNSSSEQGAAKIEPIPPSAPKYRLKTPEEYAAETKTEIPVLRKYLKYSRLEDVILKCPLPSKAKLTPEQKKEEMTRRTCFLDFLRGLFQLNPYDRWTAKQAAEHPFIAGGLFTGPFQPSVDAKANERKLGYLMHTQKSKLTPAADGIPPLNAFAKPNTPSNNLPFQITNSTPVITTNASSSNTNTVHRQPAISGPRVGGDTRFQPLQKRMSEPVVRVGGDHRPSLQRGQPVHKREANRDRSRTGSFTGSTDHGSDGQYNPNSRSRTSSYDSEMQYGSSPTSRQYVYAQPSHMQIHHPSMSLPMPVMQHPDLQLMPHQYSHYSPASSLGWSPQSQQHYYVATSNGPTIITQTPAIAIVPGAVYPQYHTADAAYSYSGMAYPSMAHYPGYVQQGMYPAQPLYAYPPGGAHYAPQEGAYIAASLGSDLSGYGGSMQDGGSVYATDFGQALMRPEINGRRQIQSQEYFMQLSGSYSNRCPPGTSPATSTSVEAFAQQLNQLKMQAGDEKNSRKEGLGSADKAGDDVSTDKRDNASSRSSSRCSKGTLSKNNSSDSLKNKEGCVSKNNSSDNLVASSAQQTSPDEAEAGSVADWDPFFEADDMGSTSK